MWLRFIGLTVNFVGAPVNFALITSALYLARVFKNQCTELS